MGGFHHEDEVGPFDLIERERHHGIVIQSGGIHFDGGMIAENHFRCRAAEFVLRAQE